MKTRGGAFATSLFPGLALMAAALLIGLAAGFLFTPMMGVVIALAMIIIMLMRPRGLWPSPEHGKSLANAPKA